jgi:hypothetical protein
MLGPYDNKSQGLFQKWIEGSKRPDLSFRAAAAGLFEIRETIAFARGHNHPLEILPHLQYCQHLTTTLTKIFTESRNISLGEA